MNTKPIFTSFTRVEFLKRHTVMARGAVSRTYAPGESGWIPNRLVGKLISKGLAKELSQPSK